jgi:hypothetical protein
MKHVKKLYEEEERANPFAELEKALQIAAQAIIDETVKGSERETKNTAPAPASAAAPTETPSRSIREFFSHSRESGATNESLITGWFIGGAILSIGKLSALVGNVLTNLGYKVHAKEGSHVFKIAEWMVEHGEKYTEKIESLLESVMNKIPVLNKFMKTLNSRQRKSFAKAVLTITLIVFAGKGVIDLATSMMEGHGAIAAIEGIFTGTKTTEIVGNLQKILPNIFGATSKVINNAAA